MGVRYGDNLGLVMSWPRNIGCFYKRGTYDRWRCQSCFRFFLTLVVQQIHVTKMVRKTYGSSRSGED